MADEEDKKVDEEELDLDDDLAEALSEEGEVDVDGKSVDELLKAEAPDFEKELPSIEAKDFEGVVIEKGDVSEEVDESAQVPSPLKAFISNLPEEQKLRYKAAGLVVAILLPLALLVYMGKILPRFELPYILSMDELTDDVYTYSTTGVEVPLFDDFRSKAVTYSLPKTMINLRTDGDQPSYGQFEFFLSLRDKESEPTIKARQSEIIDILQRVLERVSWNELQSPMGKEKVKKAIRHRLNEYLQANIVIGVYYRSIILNK